MFTQHTSDQHLRVSRALKTRVAISPRSKASSRRLAQKSSSLVANNFRNGCLLWGGSRYVTAVPVCGLVTSKLSKLFWQGILGNYPQWPRRQKELCCLVSVFKVDLCFSLSTLDTLTKQQGAFCRYGHSMIDTTDIMSISITSMTSCVRQQGFAR